MNVYGIWNEYWPNKSESFPFNKLIPPGEREKLVKGVQKEIEYLKEGCDLLGNRRIIQCLVTGNFMDCPLIYHDDKNIWTKEYIHYVENGFLQLDESLKKKHYK